MKRFSGISRIGLTLIALFSAGFFVVYLTSIEVNANMDVQIDPNISVTPSNLPFGKVFPEEVLLKKLEISLSSSCVASKKISGLSYTIVQQSKPRYSKDEAYCASHPTDLVKCYPSLCPYLSKTPDGTPGNDSGVPAFHDPSASSSIAHGELNSTTDKSDNWTIDLHVPCFKGQCAQDNIVPTAYELDPKFIDVPFGCNLNIVVGTTSTSASLLAPWKEHYGTPYFWKNWQKSGYTEGQINGWLSLINASSSWLIVEAGYTANTAGMVQLVNDSGLCNPANRACAKKKFLAEYLSSRLDFESGRKLLTNAYNLNMLLDTYWGVSNPVTLGQAFAKTEGKLPDNGTTPTVNQFLLMQGGLNTINNTGI